MENNWWLLNVMKLKSATNEKNRMKAKNVLRRSWKRTQIDNVAHSQWENANYQTILLIQDLVQIYVEME